MNKYKGTAIISTLIGGAAIMVGAFYFLMGQINRVSDKADAAVLSSSEVAGDVKAVKQSVEDLKTQESVDSKNMQSNLDNLNAKINLILQRTK